MPEIEWALAELELGPVAAIELDLAADDPVKATCQNAELALYRRHGYLWWRAPRNI